MRSGDIEASTFVLQAVDNQSVRRHDAAVRALFAAHFEDNSEAVFQAVLPTLRFGITKILQKGHADAISRDDFYHAHLVYPRKALLSYPAAAELESNLEILYHTRERPHRIRAGWIEEIAGIREPFVQAWVRELRRTDFDYRDFFYGSRRIVRRDPLSPESITQLAEAWQQVSDPRADLQILRERIVYLHGSTQPGYEKAAEFLFFPRSFLTPLGSQALHPAPVHPPEYVSIATVYFRRGPGIDPMSPGPCGYDSGTQGYWPQRATSGTWRHRGFCYTMVVYRSLLVNPG
jgi:hypothetical protein